MPNGPFIHLFAALWGSHFVIPLCDMPAHLRIHDTGKNQGKAGLHIPEVDRGTALSSPAITWHLQSHRVSHREKKEFKGFEITVHSVKITLYRKRIIKCL